MLNRCSYQQSLMGIRKISIDGASRVLSGRK